MVYGEFTAFGQAQVTLTLRSDTGEESDITAVVDTGYMGFLMLPRSLAARLGLPQIEEEILVMANGSYARFPVHEAVILWQGEERVVAAHVSEGEALIGVDLLRDNVATLEFCDGGSVTIEPIQ